MKLLEFFAYENDPFQNPRYDNEDDITVRSLDDTRKTKLPSIKPHDYLIHSCNQECFYKKGVSSPWFVLAFTATKWLHQGQEYGDGAEQGAELNLPIDS